jgi:hypothetical protein
LSFRNLDAVSPQAGRFLSRAAVLRTGVRPTTHPAVGRMVCDRCRRESWIMKRQRSGIALILLLCLHDVEAARLRDR